MGFISERLLEYLIEKPPVPMKRVTVSLIRFIFMQFIVTYSTGVLNSFLRFNLLEPELFF